MLYAGLGDGMCPGGDKYTSKDEKIYTREQIRLKLSLDAAKNSGFEKIIVMLHYPPTNDKFEESEFTRMIKEYSVEKVIYGHLHGPVLLGKVLNGYLDGVEYILTSADYLNFDPKRYYEADKYRMKFNSTNINRKFVGV